MSQAPKRRKMRQIEAAGRLSSQRRSSQQNGNAMLEPALIFLPMIAIFLGIVDV